MNVRRTGTAVLGVLLAACSQLPPGTVVMPTPPPLPVGAFELTAEEQAVYAAALTKIIGGFEPDLVVVSRLTLWSNVDGWPIELGHPLDQPTRDAIANCTQRNDRKYGFTGTFRLQYALLFIDPTASTFVDPPGPRPPFGNEWNGLREHCAKCRGLFSVSRIGFDAQETYAFLEISEDGYGEYMVLKRTDNGWAVEEETLAWVA